jgi:hypothetical protein
MAYQRFAGALTVAAMVLGAGVGVGFQVQEAAAGPVGPSGTRGLAQSREAAPAIPSPPAGMGQVVFYRSSRLGRVISCQVREGDQVLNRLPPSKYFIHVATPGAHEYSVRSEARDLLRLEVEDGETYYVRCAIGMGIGLGRPNLSPQSREDFDRRGGGLDLLPPYGAEGDND